MIIVGITGSVGMGKSTATGMLRGMRYPVFDADERVRGLLTDPGIISAIAREFPEAVSDGRTLDKSALRAAVFMNGKRLDALEKILHPAVAKERNDFITACEKEGKDIIFLDIPLLFEIGANTVVNHTAVITAPSFVQKIRVLQRPNMTPEYLDFLLKRQMPNARKCARADTVIYSCFGYAAMRLQLKIMIRKIQQTKLKAQKNDTTNRS